MAKRVTMEQFRLGLLRMTKDFRKFMLPPMRISISQLRKRTAKDIKSTGLGKALWKNRRRKKSGTPPLILKTIRARVSRGTNALTVGLRMTGMGAIQEVGGTTAAHTITAKNAGRLNLPPAFPRQVNHPGSKLKKREIMLPNFDKQAPRIERLVGAALQRLAERSL